MSYAFWNWTWLARRRAARPTRQRPTRNWFVVELLEARAVPTAGIAQPDYVLLPNSTATPFVGPGGDGFAPAQVRQAYGLTGVAGDGTGTTIAIVDAYDDPKLASDLVQFDTAFGLPATNLSKVNENGGATLPKGNTGWAEETALDVEWAHAIAPGANILLVEASSAAFNDLFAAVKTAAKGSDVVAVSMSWGGSEFAGEATYDSDFTTPTGHDGVSFITSSGDAGAPVSYPAASPNVLSVGGTTLSLSSGGSILSEAGWSGSGGGISTKESQPAYQKGIVTQSTTHRTNPDVAYDADPNTGFPVYNSYSFPSSPWQEFGGTSDAAPQWAALVAITDQDRSAAGLGSLDGATQLLPMIYSASASAFHDIASGTSTGSPRYTAAAGYDLVTGRGTPVASNLIPYLVGSASTTNPTLSHFSVTASATDVAGSTAFAVTVTALDGNNDVLTGYVGTVQVSSSDPHFTPINVPFTSADQGVHTFTVVLKTAGTQSITVTDAATGISDQTTTVVSPATASALAFAQQPTSTTAGAVISPAVTVDVLDPYGNLVTNYIGSVSLTLLSNPVGATLTGGSVSIFGGVATFSGLTVSAAGTGDTLQATAGILAAATSASFTITTAGGGGGGGGSSGGLIEGFETPDDWYVSGNGYDTAYLSTAAAHDGSAGLDLTGPDWFYRTDAGATVNAGDTLSAWVQFAGAADGRAYLGFASSAYGTLSLVAAPNSNQLLLQSNSGYTAYTNLAAANERFQANHWYRLEVDWSTSGTIIGKVFDSNGTTLLRSVTAKVTGVTTGGIALRSIGSDKYWDTLTDTPGVNTFNRAVTKHAVHITAPASLPATHSSAASTAAMESAVAEYVAAKRLEEGWAYRYWW